MVGGVETGRGVEHFAFRYSLPPPTPAAPVGSDLVRLIEETPHLHERVAAKFVKPFVEALNAGANGG